MLRAVRNYAILFKVLWFCPEIRWTIFRCILIEPLRFTVLLVFLLIMLPFYVVLRLAENYEWFFDKLCFVVGAPYHFLTERQQRLVNLAHAKLTYQEIRERINK